MIVVYTTHKCASTLQRRFFKALSIVSSLQFFDPAGEYWSNRHGVREEYKDYTEYLKSKVGDFSRTDSLLVGPIRSMYSNPVFTSKIIIYRNPIDVILSEYVSFGWTHPLPLSGVGRERFMKRRALIQNLTLDEYADLRLKDILDHYKFFRDLKHQGASVYSYSELLDLKAFYIKIALMFNLKKNYWIIVRLLILVAEFKAKSHKTHTSRGFMKHRDLSDEQKKIIENAFLSEGLNDFLND